MTAIQISTLQLITAALLAGCGSMAPSASPDGGEPDATPDAAGPAFMASGMVTEEGSAPIAGATVTLLDHPEVPPATTDASGNYTMAIPFLPSATLIAVNVTAPGHLGETFLEAETTLGTWWPSVVPLQTTAMAAERLATQAGFEYPTTDGSAFVRLRVSRLTGGAPGASVVLSPASGSGPVYAAADGTLDPALTSTSTFGVLLFGNVVPGRYAATVTLPGKTCSVIRMGVPVGGDWPPGADGGTLSLEAAANSITEGNDVICE